MIDYVLDATFVAFSNGDLAGRRPGNVLDRRLKVVEEVIYRQDRRLRYNQRLRREYEDHAKTTRNDFVEVFFSYLDSNRPFRVPRNTLSRQHYNTATKIRWPGHDQHLLAAAIGGIKPHLFVTEHKHAVYAAKVKQAFGITVLRV